MKILKLPLFAISFLLMGNSSQKFLETAENTSEQISVYPPDNYKHNTYQLIEILANELKINHSNLFELIYFETAGTLDPTVNNPYSSAKGMIQFTDATSKLLKDSDGNLYSNSKDLIEKCGTVECQLAKPSKSNTFGGPVYQYLKRFKNLRNKQELYMAVFYPKAMTKTDFTFPEHVRNKNPGIENIDDYINLAEERLKENTTYVD